MIIMDGKLLASKIESSLKEEILNLSKNNIIPTLSIIKIGQDDASDIYINNKKKICDRLNIKYEIYDLKESTTNNEIESLITTLNKREYINGIMIQSPIKSKLEINEIINLIDPRKDIEGLTKINIGKQYLNEKTFIPCTPLGIIKLLEEYKIELGGKNIVILGRSNIVGKPLFTLLTNKNATVTLCHSKTKNIEHFTKNADILITSIGKPNYIKENMIKENSIIIDVGINKDINNKLTGDVDFYNVKNKVSYITPVPNGVGPMTVIMLISNLIDATNYNRGDKYD